MFFINILKKNVKNYLQNKKLKKLIAIIKKSSYFDEAFYRKTYNIPKNVDCAEHYLTKGYLCGYNPSPDFDSIKYENYYKLFLKNNGNPLIRFEQDHKSIENKHDVSFPNNCIEIEKKFVLQPPKHKRVAIFASFSNDGRIHDDVIFYLNGLKEIVDNIILIGDNPVFEDEILKIRDLVYFCKFIKHNEYDFGSYKIGYRFLKENNLLNDADELLFCNDSCIGPIFPFSEVIGQAKPIKCDFWGLTSSTNICFHIQSYFFVLRNSVIKSNVMDSFFSYVKPQESPENVIFYYEMKLTQFLEFHNFNGFAVYKRYGIQNLYEDYELISNPLEFMLNYRMPLVKKKVLDKDSEYGKSAKYIQKTKNYIKSIQPELKY